MRKRYTVINFEMLPMRYTESASTLRVPSGLLASKAEAWWYCHSATGSEALKTLREKEVVLNGVVVRLLSSVDWMEDMVDWKVGSEGRAVGCGHCGPRREELARMGWDGCWAQVEGV